MSFNLQQARGWKEKENINQLTQSLEKNNKRQPTFLNVF